MARRTFLRRAGAAGIATIVAQQMSSANPRESSSSLIGDILLQTYEDSQTGYTAHKENYNSTTGQWVADSGFPKTVTSIPNDSNAENNDQGIYDGYCPRLSFFIPLTRDGNYQFDSIKQENSWDDSTGPDEEWGYYGGPGSLAAPQNGTIRTKKTAKFSKGWRVTAKYIKQNQS